MASVERIRTRLTGLTSALSAFFTFRHVRCYAVCFYLVCVFFLVIRYDGKSSTVVRCGKRRLPSTTAEMMKKFSCSVEEEGITQWNLSFFPFFLFWIIIVRQYLQSIFRLCRRFFTSSNSFFFRASFGNHIMHRRRWCVFWIYRKKTELIIAISFFSHKILSPIVYVHDADVSFVFINH